MEQKLQAMTTRDDMLHSRNCPPCTGDCNQGRLCPAQPPRQTRIDWMWGVAVVCVLWADLMRVIRKTLPRRTHMQMEPRRRWLHFMPSEAGGFLLGAMIGVVLGLGAGVIAWLVLA